MKIYLDDIRYPKNPEGVTIIRSYDDFYFIWEHNKHIITSISFDHDLGTEKSGYDALCLVEEDIKTGVIKHHIELNVHTANPSGMERMKQVINSIIGWRLSYC